MFNYFWQDLGYLWDEDAFENLFKLLAKGENADYLPFLFQSKTLLSIFEAMSYQYRFSFIQHVLQTRKDMLEELN